MLIPEHERHGLSVLGNPFTEIHEWMDQYYEVVDNVAHRVVLHHRYGIELGVSLFGESARRALELHIEDDFEFIPGTPDEVAQMMRDQYFLTPDEVNIMKPELSRLFPHLVVSIDSEGWSQKNCVIATGFAAVRWALCFSILSAYRIDWREVQVKRP